MNDVVFVLGKGSLWNDTELRYSLRSIEKHLKNYKDIWVIGECPAFLQNVKHIYFKDEHPCKETNIYRKVLRACQEKEITDDFLFFNDDHFLLQDFNAKEFPYFWKSNLRDSSKMMKPGNRYKKAVDNAYRTLHSLGLETKSFDTHTPIIYNKKKFIEVMTKFNWDQKVSYVVKSMYANSLQIEGVREVDCKINSQLTEQEIKEVIKDRKVFSMGNGAIGFRMLSVLNDLYPKASKYERN